jgi:hypothetical protein
MKYFIFSFVVVLGVIPCRCWSQDQVAIATDALGSVLSNLKQSVEHLTVDNEQLARKDSILKQEVYQLRLRLEQLQQQEGPLNKAAVKLKDKNENRAKQISRLEEESFSLDNCLQKTLDASKVIQQALPSGYQENQKLLQQVDLIQGQMAAPSLRDPEAPSLTSHRQKEKLRLMKMIYDSQCRQQSLHKSMADHVKQTPLLPAAGVLAHQQVLKETSSAVDQWDATHLRQLEDQLKTLEHNYSQLEILFGQMTKKAQSTGMTVSQHIEQGQLKGNIDDLNRQEAGLKVALEDLRSQMIDLDKRKSSLETVIKQFKN